ncbi:glycosyltransferase family 2 protein [Shinella sp. BYT-45]|uniref:glycosyltransferase family 2 protein n=1 Tax=Shinella sp. BYT-45 TaxID=3377377 RepID=UPI003980F70B
MTQDLVSIITPAYKAASYIGETIRSVQAQTHGAWEMLVVEDGSPDDTWKVIAAHAQADPRVKLIRQENAGPAMARQKALDHASGRYIAFLDSDDLWLAEKLERQLAFMRERSSAFSYTAFRRITADGSVTGRLIEVPAEMTYRRLLGNTAIATSTVLIDREKTGPLQMTKTYYDDFVLWLAILRRGHVAHGFNEDLMRYRVLGQSVSRNKWRSMRMVWATYRQVVGLDPFSAGAAFAGYAWHAWWKYRKF